MNKTDHWKLDGSAITLETLGGTQSFASEYLMGMQHLKLDEDAQVLTSTPLSSPGYSRGMFET